jgi:hypothetical protein
VRTAETNRGVAPTAGADGLAAWAQASGHRRGKRGTGGGSRSAFCGRVSTEDWQDPVTSRARQREQADALIRGHGGIVAEFFDQGQSRTAAWGRRPQAAALVAQLAGPNRGWDAVVVGLSSKREVTRTGYPGADRDGGPGARAGPLPGRASALRVPSR